MRVLFFGTYDARRHPHVRVLYEGLRDLGDEIIERNEVLGIPTNMRVELLRHPWLTFILLARIVSTWVRLARSACCVRDVDAVVVGHMGHFDVHLARRLWPRVPIVLDYMISLRGTAVDRRVTRRSLLFALSLIDRAAVRTADIVCVDTVAHWNLVPPRYRPKTVVVPLGAPDHWFIDAEWHPDEQLRVIFHGLFAPLQGAPTIGEAIALLAGEPIRFTLVGRGQDLEETKRAASRNPAVEWRDWVCPEHLPDLVAGHDVCLGIFGTTDKGLRVVPHKVFEGAAAGCAIITSDTPVQRDILGDGATFVPPGDAVALAEAIKRLQRDRTLLKRAREAAGKRARERFRADQVVRGLRSKLFPEEMS